MPSAQTYQAIAAQVAKALAKARKQRGLSMNRLAEMTGLSLTIVSYVERGLRNPTLDTLLRLTGALEVDLGSLIQEASRAVK